MYGYWFIGLPATRVNKINWKLKRVIDIQFIFSSPWRLDALLHFFLLLLFYSSSFIQFQFFFQSFYIISVMNSIGTERNTGFELMKAVLRATFVYHESQPGANLIIISCFHSAFVFCCRRIITQRMNEKKKQKTFVSQLVELSKWWWTSILMRVQSSFLHCLRNEIIFMGREQQASRSRSRNGKRQTNMKRRRTWILKRWFVTVF